METELAEKVEGQTQEPTQVTPVAEEATPEVGQEAAPENWQAKAEQLKAERDAVAAKLEERQRQLGERDKGLARKHEENEKLKEKLADLDDKIEVMESHLFGVDEPETLQGRAAYERDLRERKARRQPSQVTEFQYTPPELVAIGKMQAYAEEYGVDFSSPPPELLTEVNKFWNAGQLNEAVAAYKKGLREIKTVLKSKTDEETKTKKEYATMQAAVMKRENIASSGSPRSIGMFTPKQIRDMPDEEYAKQRPAIEAAMREGKLTQGG
ncbi:MAG: hypothetical protein Q8K68_13775 [Nitrospirota bacterium]|nr:hypothetical protein [Nitrospirota bacterium]